MTQAPLLNIIRLGRLDFPSFMAALWSMAVIGWIPGAVFDFTGSYQATLVNALASVDTPTFTLVILLPRRPGRRSVAI